MFSAFLTHASSVLVSLFCLGLYCLQNGTQLDSGAIFSSLALSNQLTVPLFIFPITVPIIIAAIVSRDTNFLFFSQGQNVRSR